MIDCSVIVIWLQTDKLITCHFWCFGILNVEILNNNLISFQSNMDKLLHNRLVSFLVMKWHSTGNIRLFSFSKKVIVEPAAVVQGVSNQSWSAAILILYLFEPITMNGNKIQWSFRTSHVLQYSIVVIDLRMQYCQMPIWRIFQNNHLSSIEVTLVLSWAQSLVSLWSAILDMAVVQQM